MTTAHQTDETARRVRLGARLTLASVAAFLVAVPFMLLLVLVRSEVPWLLDLDRTVARDLHRLLLDHEVLTDVAEVVDVVTHPNVLRVLAVLAAVALWRRGRRRVAIWLLVTMAAGGLLNLLIKELTQRGRPAFPDAIDTFAGYSFPSGHAMNSAVAAGCVLVLLHPRLRGGARWALWLAAIAFVLLVGLDRVAIGAHYVSDVVAGWVAGAAVVCATVAAFALGRQEEGLPPSSTEEGLDPENAGDARTTAQPR